MPSPHRRPAETRSHTEQRDIYKDDSRSYRGADDYNKNRDWHEKGANGESDHKKSIRTTENKDGGTTVKTSDSWKDRTGNERTKTSDTTTSHNKADNSLSTRTITVDTSARKDGSGSQRITDTTTTKNFDRTSSTSTTTTSHEFNRNGSVDTKSKSHMEKRDAQGKVTDTKDTNSTGHSSNQWGI